MSHLFFRSRQRKSLQQQCRHGRGQEGFQQQRLRQQETSGSATAAAATTSTFTATTATAAATAATTATTATTTAPTAAATTATATTTATNDVINAHDVINDDTVTQRSRFKPDGAAEACADGDSAGAAGAEDQGQLETRRNRI